MTVVILGGIMTGWGGLLVGATYFMRPPGVPLRFYRRPSGAPVVTTFGRTIGHLGMLLTYLGLELVLYGVDEIPHGIVLIIYSILMIWAFFWGLWMRRGKAT